MGFQKLIYFMLNNRGTSTKISLNRFFESTGENTRMSQQAFSKARSKVNHLPFLELFNMTANIFYQDKSQCHTWHDYIVSAIDGSSIAVANTLELRDYFGVSGRHPGSATARASIQYDILNDVILDARIGKFSTGEREVAKEHISIVVETTKHEKHLILFDRGYPSFQLISYLNAANASFLMRVRHKFNRLMLLCRTFLSACI